MRYDLEKIGKTIRQERNKLTWTQDKLGKILGVTGKQISNYENGKLLPPQDILLKMAALFNCEYGYLLGEESYKDGSKLTTAICESLGLVRVAGGQIKGICVVLKEFPASSSGKANIHQRFVLLDALDHIVLDRDLGEFLKDLPGSGGMDIVVQNNLADFPQKCRLVQIVQRGIELVGIRILAVYNDSGSAASLQKVIDSVFGYEPCICDLAHVREVVLMMLVEKTDKFLVVI